MSASKWYFVVSGVLEMEEEKKRLIKEMEKIKEAELPKKEKEKEKEKRINELTKQLGKLYLGGNPKKSK